MTSPLKDYTKPSWAGKSSLESLAVELIVAGEVRQRVDLDLREHDAFLIGREKNCDVVLEGLEKMASRYHCVLQCKEGSPEIYVYDLKSSHGTLLNGKQIDPYKFEPLHVGGQLKFNAIKPTPRDVLAVLCGPEEAMEEEGEIDLAQFREEAAKEVAAREKAIMDDLAKRKAAKKKRMHTEAQREAVTKAYAAQAEKKMKQLRAMEEADKARRHQVTWGEGVDAVEVPMEELDEAAKELLDANGKLDLDKVRKLSLTQKQEEKVQNLEKKQKKIGSLRRAKQKQEDLADARARRKAAAELDIDELPDSGMGKDNMERIHKLIERIQKAEEDFATQADVLFVSLGMKKASFGRITKKQAAQYDTHLDDSDDEFFDRTAGKESTEQPEVADIPSEFVGLPTLDKVENQKSLEAKVAQLRTEQARTSAQLAAEKVKISKQPAAGEEEDSLDAFMNATVAQLRDDKGQKLQKRLQEVGTRLKTFEAMLVEAKTNSEEGKAAKPQPRPKAEPKAAPKTSSKPPPTSTAEVLARLTAMDEKEKAKAEAAAEPEAKAPTPMTPAKAAAPKPAPKPAAPAPPQAAKPEVHIDLEKAGLQFLNTKPEAKRRKVYGVTMPPPVQRNPRDMDQAASGELQEPEG